MYCKALTKQQLIDWGITKVELENGVWNVYRNWYTAGKRTAKSKKVESLVKITLAEAKHKYTNTITYEKVSFSVGNKSISLPLSRLIYCWHIADIEDGYVIDHLNANRFDNRLDNLQKITIKENLAKRYIDNPANHVNQYR